MVLPACVVRVENRTGKSRPDRHRIPYKPIVYCIDKKKQETGKKTRENTAGTGAEAVRGDF